ncbi:MAG: tyrosine-type recombinase/integrase [Azoarcus sp.]|nr:tyrosine-type recombinase/integrase [Azoarcus sp.]
MKRRSDCGHVSNGGENPRVVRAVEKGAIQTAVTFKELFKDWYDKSCSKEKSAHAEIYRSFELHIFDRFGALPAGKITLHMWLDTLEGMAARIPAIADRILMNAKECYWWGVKRQLVEENPLDRLDGGSDLRIPRNVQVRPLADLELFYIWRALNGSRLAYKNKLLMKLALAYACRWGELRLAEKSHFDFQTKIWTVPPENHKIGRITGKPLLRPIMPHTEELIREAFMLSPKHQFVFVSGRTGARMSPTSQTSWTYRIQEWVLRNFRYEMRHWTIHDFRASARTRFSKLTDPHIAEKMIGHKLKGVWELYDRHDYIEEQKLTVLGSGLITMRLMIASSYPSAARAWR